MILGIDTGDHGCLCFLEDAQSVFVDMPMVRLSRTRLELDISELHRVLLERKPSIAYMEALHPMPGKLGGSNANFKRGGYLYAFRAFFCAMGVRLREVGVKQWQKEFGIKNTKDSDTKAQAYLIASRLYPDVDLKTERGVIIDGRADALLIARYGQLQEGRAAA